MPLLNEIQIRELLIERLAKSSEGKNAAFIKEMFVDDFCRRADLVMANGKLSVFEIKSGLDSLDRLEGQLESYTKYFERVTVVCAAKHYEKVMQTIPETVGIWTVSEEGVLRATRAAKSQDELAPTKWLSFLPVGELKALLRANKLKLSGTRGDLIDRALAIRVKTIRAYVLAYLKRREIRIQLLKDKRQGWEVQTEAVDHSAKIIEFIRTYANEGSLKAIPRKVA